MPLKISDMTTATPDGNETVPLVKSGANVKATLKSIAASALVFLQGGTSAVYRSLQTKLREVQVTPLDFGAVADDVTDCFAAFRACQNYCRDNGIGTMFIPGGKYYLSAEWEIDSHIVIRGAQGYSFSFNANAVILRFPKNVNGIRFCNSTTSTSGGRANDSTLQDVQLRCSDATTTSGSGIVMDVRAKCVNVLVTAFGLDGFHIDATSTDTPSKNANNWSLERCKAASCYRDGLYVNGGDANAGYCIGFSATSCGRNGIFDSSFLGNTYVGCHTSGTGNHHLVTGSDATGYFCILDHVAATNTIPVSGVDWATYWVARGSATTFPAPTIGLNYYGTAVSDPIGGRSYCTDSNNAKNVFVGCYAESGQARNPYIIYPAYVVGGNMGTVEPENGTHAIRPWFRAMQSITKDSAGDSVTANLGSPQSVDTISALEWQATVSSVALGNWRFDYDKVNKVWNWWNGSASNRAFRMQDTGSTLWTNLPVGTFNFGAGLGLNNNRLQVLSAIPGSGTYAQSDLVFNTAIGNGKVVLWGCTVAGSPGTWRTLLVAASISADKGNAAATLTPASSDTTAVWNTPLTVNRAVTLSTTNAWNGAKFHIVRTAAATGGFTLDVGTGPLKSLAVGQWCDVEYDGGAWFLSAFGSL